MHANPSPRQPPARTSAIQVLPSSAGNKLVHSSTQQQNTERESNRPAIDDYAGCYDEVYYSSISESEGDSNTTSPSVVHTFFHIAATRMRPGRLAMVKARILCLAIHIMYLRIKIV